MNFKFTLQVYFKTPSLNNLILLLFIQWATLRVTVMPVKDPSDGFRKMKDVKKR